MTENKLEKLQEAVERQAANLDPAQREFVLEELRTYQWNAKKIADLERQIDENPHNEDGLKVEGALVKERHQIITEQTALFGHIMRWLKGTNAEQSELESFLS